MNRRSLIKLLTAIPAIIGIKSSATSFTVKADKTSLLMKPARDEYQWVEDSAFYNGTPVSLLNYRFTPIQRDDAQQRSLYRVSKIG